MPNPWVLIIGACAILVPPPFNDKIELLGSSEFVEEDWDRTVEGTVPYTFIRMEAGGVRLQPQGEPARTIAQHKVEFTRTADKVAWARFRITFDHGDEMPGFFGFFSTDTNPCSDPPAYMACFGTEDHDGTYAKLFAITRENGGESVNKDELTTFFKGATWDFVLKIDGTSGVTYWQKSANSSTWSDPHEITTDLPEGAMRFSMAVCNPAANLGSHLYRVFEFEADR